MLQYCIRRYKHQQWAAEKHATTRNSQIFLMNAQPQIAMAS